MKAELKKKRTLKKGLNYITSISQFMNFSFSFLCMCVCVMCIFRRHLHVLTLTTKKWTRRTKETRQTRIFVSYPARISQSVCSERRDLRYLLVCYFLCNQIRFMWRSHLNLVFQYVFFFRIFWWNMTLMSDFQGLVVPESHIISVN